jgi:hypothetical protein
MTDIKDMTDEELVEAVAREIIGIRNIEYRTADKCGILYIDDGNYEYDYKPIPEPPPIDAILRETSLEKRLRKQAWREISKKHGRVRNAN